MAQKSSFSLSNPPLICVVARVQFAPVTEIADYISDLSKALRMRGLVLPHESKTGNIQIDERGAAGTNVSFKELTRWTFANLEETFALRVDQESVSLLSTHYQDFEHARPQYEEALKAVEETIPKIARLGMQLRYINHLPFERGESPANWVNIPVLGMPNVGDLARQASVSETSFQTPEGGRLITRCSNLARGLTLPPDLLPLKMALKYEQERDAPFILLENVNLLKAVNPDFTAENCLNEFSDLRAHIDTIFQEVVTPQALKIWQ